MIDVKTGFLRLENCDLVLGPSSALENFLDSAKGLDVRSQVVSRDWSSHFFDAQLLGGTVAVILLFRQSKLWQVQLSQVAGARGDWSDWSEEAEQKKKLQHDRTLETVLGKPPYRFPWGTVESSYDPKSASSAIIISYQN